MGEAWVLQESSGSVLESEMVIFIDHRLNLTRRLDTEGSASEKGKSKRIKTSQSETNLF